MNNQGLVEIRVPAFRRPELLRRCLNSILAQTHHDWVALVLDDSQEEEGGEVVSEFNDSRICYRPNRINLGCCGNLDLAFSPSPMAGGEFACVIEDDNWALPDFLKSNLNDLESSKLSVLLRNQIIANEMGGGKFDFSGKTTQGDVFGEVDAILSPLDIHAGMFFGTGLSNGGIFWKLKREINFTVGRHIVNSQMQEYIRSLNLRENVLYAADPLAVFSLSNNGSTTREGLTNRQFNRGRQVILELLIKKYGNLIIKRGFEMAKTTPNLLNNFKSSLVYCSPSPLFAWKIKSINFFLPWIKGMYVRKTVQSPIPTIS